MKKLFENRIGRMTLAMLFWLVVWQVASMLIGEALFLPSPFAVLQALLGMAGQGRFWLSVGNSLGRIALGFLLGLCFGCLLAALAHASRLVEALVSPLMLLVRSTPVASFIILALVWIDSSGLSTFISFLMVLPVLYNATYSGIAAADGKLLEMAALFRIGFWRKVRAVWLPALMPGLLSACELGLGMSWKSGVAAEVIGLPSGTIGERLYQAKIFLMTPQLFAWTVVIILASWVFGKAVLWVLTRLAARLQRGRALPPAPQVETAFAPGPPAPARPVALRAVAVAKAYGEKCLYREFSAEVEAGEAVAFMGPSGNGKTTLARLLMGLEKPDAGEVEGVQAARFACVFQEDRLCEQLSAAQNVALVLPKNRWHTAAPALYALGLTKAEIDKPVASLSGGERRRVALARAVQAESDVLVLDEAFNGLDAGSRKRAADYIKQGLYGHSLMLITHSKTEAETFGARVVDIDAVAAGCE